LQSLTSQKDVFPKRGEKSTIKNRPSKNDDKNNFNMMTKKLWPANDEVHEITEGKKNYVKQGRERISRQRPVSHPAIEV